MAEYSGLIPPRGHPEDSGLCTPHSVVFFGTPAFAVPTLEALADDERFSVRLVVTQPPRPSGRGRTIHRSAVHVAAEVRNLDVFTPERLRGPEVLARLAAMNPTLFVVAAYGKILRPDVLAIPAQGTLNVHASLLPAYRGASPINAAILDGVPETGVTIMLMDQWLDTGPILSQVHVPIAPDATAGTLTELLAAVGAPLLAESAAAWVEGAIAPIPQDEAAATHTRLLTKEDGAIDWSLPAARIARMERAYDPWPGVYTMIDAKRLIVRGLYVAAQDGDAEPGTIVAVDAAGIHVRAADGDVVIATVQPEGKGAMPAIAFARGRRSLVGKQLVRSDQVQA